MMRMYVGLQALGEERKQKKKRDASLFAKSLYLAIDTSSYCIAVIRGGDSMSLRNTQYSQIRSRWDLLNLWTPRSE